MFCGLSLAGLWWPTPALAAGDTRYDAGLNLPFNEKAGNVNPQTGNLTLTSPTWNCRGGGASTSASGGSGT